MKHQIGIKAFATYLPETYMTAKEVSEKTKGIWTEEAIIEKLGFHKKPIPGIDDGTQAMGAKAGLKCLEKFNYDPKKIDVILCIGEEWKEYPLTTSGIYIQEKIGATNAWAIDVQQRCCSMVAAMKIAKDMLIADEEISSIMVVGGYRNGDFVDYANPRMSMMYNLGAGACALILEKNCTENLLLGTQLMTDGSLAWDAGCRIGGTTEPVSAANLEMAYQSLDLMQPEHMKDRLNLVSMPNWFRCIDRSLEKSGLTRSQIDYLAILHFKKSMHLEFLKTLELKETQTTYLSQFGHIGQIDQVLSLEIGLQEGKIKPGSHVCMIAAGIGYAWAANVIRWG